MSRITTTDKTVKKNIKRALDKLPKLSPATLDGKAVRYEYSFAQSSYKALRIWSTKWEENLFAQSINNSLESGYLINIAFVDKLPTYNNASLNSYKRAIIGRAIEKLATNNRSTTGSVDIRVLLGADGRVGKVEVLWKGKSEEFAKAVAEAYVELPVDLWQPAQIANKPVDCTIWM